MTNTRFIGAILKQQKRHYELKKQPTPSQAQNQMLALPQIQSQQFQAKQPNSLWFAIPDQY